MRFAPVLFAGVGLIAVETPQMASAQAWTVDTVRTPGRVVEFTATSGTWMNVDVAPDGRTLVFDLLGHLYEIDAAGGQARILTRGNSWNMQPRYSPDGSRILFTSDRSGMNAIWVLHRGQGSVEQLSKGDQWTAGGSWTADGRGFYATTMDIGARFGAVRLDQWGSRHEFARPATFTPPTHFVEPARSGRVYFSVPGGPVFQGGFQVKSYDLRTGETSTIVQRPGGAASPAISRDGRWLAYAHRDDKRTQLVLHDLQGGSERVLLPSIDRDRQEAGAGTGYGAYPAFAFTPDGNEVVLAFGGGLHAVSARTGAVRDIPFSAPVRRQMAQRLAFPVRVPDEGNARTRSHRFGVPVDAGVVYEALGDLYLLAGTQRTNLTSSAAHEASPAYDPATRTLFYASWDDDSSGAIWSRPLGGAPRRLTRTPSQYGSLALSPDGRALAFVRGTDALLRGASSLEEQLSFDLVLLGTDGVERRVTGLSAVGTTHSGIVGQPPGVSFSPDGQHLYYTEFAGDSLVLRRIRTDGEGKELLYVFPNAVTALVSPDLRWILFREYHRTFITPFAFAGRPVTVSAFDKQGASFRVDANDGAYAGFTRDGRVHWTRGTGYYEKAIADITANRGTPTRAELSFDFPVASPTGVIALTNARVLTMDATRRVLDRATIIVRRNKIEAVGPNVRVPAGAHVIDLRGKVVMPGMIDAHAHYNPALSMLHTVEQRHNGLLANLAYGTTTMYEVYGNVHKDFLVSDLQRSGAIAGSRLFSTGNPIYGLRTYRPKLYRPIQSMADAEEIVRFNKDHGATALKDYVQFGRAARQQLYEAARALGVNVVAETAVDPPMNFTMLVDGVTGLEHTIGLTPLFDDVTRLWAASGAGNTPTLIVSYNGPQGETMYRQAERLWDDPKVLQFFRRDQMLAGRRPTHYFDDDVYAVEMAGELRKLHAAGVSLQGSGHGQQHGLDKHWELELFVKGGFSPMDALSFATIQSATYLGLASQLGSIEAGKLADLVILDANPLANIRNSRSIDRIMLNGVLYSGKDAARLYPDPRPAKPMYFNRE